MDIQAANVLESAIQGDYLERKPRRELFPPLLGWEAQTFISVAYWKGNTTIQFLNWDTFGVKVVLLIVTLG